MLKVTSEIHCDTPFCENKESVDLSIDQHFLRAEYESDLEDVGWYFTHSKHYCPDCADYHRKEDGGEDIAYDRWKNDKLMRAWEGK